jgi:hypothetical protein
VQVAKETAQKVKVIGLYGGSTTWYMNKTSASRGREYQWVRKDREEAKQLMVAELAYLVYIAERELAAAKLLLDRARAA